MQRAMCPSSLCAGIATERAGFMMLNFGRILNKAIFSPAWPRCAEMRLSHVALSHRSSPQGIFQGMFISGHNRINSPVRC